MKISYNWIKDFIKIDLSAEKVAETLTDLGLEVEGIEKFESIKGGLKGVVVGHILECEKHPNADKLSVTKVDLGQGNIVQIVCGAPNVAKGQKVPVATIGTILFDSQGNEFQIKKGKIRGEESFGMICAEDELGLGKSHDGIMVLDPSLEAGTPCSKVFNVEIDEVFEIGLTPNRADAMSHFGVARDLKAGLLQQDINKEVMTPSVNDFFIDNRTLKIDVQVENKELVPRYCGVTISNIKVAPSPSWLQNRLKAIGITPKNNVVDVTNYVLHELGQPLHAFDAFRIADRKIIVKTASEGQIFKTLDDVERTLTASDIVISDSEKPLCIAGVMGGINSGVTENTTHIFLESAYFNPISVRKTAKRYAINSDASFRFERGIDIGNCKYALLRAAALIKKLAGGEISSEITDIYPKKAEDFQVFLTFDKVNQLIGQEIPHTTIKSILRSLDIQINSATERGLGLSIPTYRVDVQREVDVIEEILRVYGYNNVKFSEKVNATMRHASKYDDFNVQNIVSQQLTSQGFYEIMCNSLTTLQYSELVADVQQENAVKILNPLSNDLAVMRQSLLFSGLEALLYNINRKRTDLQFFEFGKSYHTTGDSYLETKHLTLFTTGNTSAEAWNKPQQKTDFFILKGNVMAIFERLGILSVEEKPTENQALQEGIAIFANNEKLADLGIVKKSVLKHFDIKQEVVYADILWENVLKNISKKLVFTEIPKYPSVRRDLALLLDAEISFKDLYKIAFETEKKLLKSMSLFDVYQGDKLPSGKKSYALSFIIQDKDKTLTDSQIDKIMNHLQENFKKRVNAELRS